MKRSALYRFVDEMFMHIPDSIADRSSANEN